MKGELHQIRRHSRTRSPGATRAAKWLSVCAALLVSYAASLPTRAESDAEAAIRMCWEEAAEARLNRGRDMPEAKSVQELLTATAGNPCREAMSGYLRACLKTGEEQGDQYPCIGAASWICRSSRWATSDIRRTACVEAEDSIWRKLLEDATTTFATFLDDEKKATRARMWQSHVELRNSTCALVRAAFEGADPSMHNANCVLHAEARLVVDLRDMLAEASGTRAKSNANGAADKTETTPPPARSDPPRAPSAPNKSEKWGALAFTAGGSYASAWQHSTKAEAEADVLKRCSKFGDGNCEVIAFAGEICAALASYKGRSFRVAYTGAGVSVPEAQRSALERCKADRRVRGACTLQTVLCGDGR